MGQRKKVSTCPHVAVAFPTLAIYKEMVVEVDKERNKEIEHSEDDDQRCNAAIELSLVE
jgi:hypothetical protein